MDTSLQTEIDIDEIKAAFGAYYIDQGQNLTNLHKLPFYSFDTKDAFTLVPTKNTQIREGLVELDEVLQAYQDEFTPKGKVKFKPVKFDLYPMKIDQEFNPSALVPSWLSFLTDTKVDREQWPFIRWIIEEYLMMKSMEDFEEKAIYTGIQADPQDGVPGDAINVMDGVKTLVKNLIAAGDLDEIATGSPNADPALFVGQVETFIKAIPEKLRRLAMTLNMSTTMQEHFVEGMQKKYNINYAQISDINKVRNFPNITVAGRPSMSGSEGMWCTPKKNALMGVRGFENVNAFKIESAKRKVAMYSDWWAGIYFIQPQLVFVNDKVSY